MALSAEPRYSARKSPRPGFQEHVGIGIGIGNRPGVQIVFREHQGSEYLKSRKVRLFVFAKGCGFVTLVPVLSQKEIWLSLFIS